MSYGKRAHGLRREPSQEPKSHEFQTKLYPQLMDSEMVGW